MSRPRKDMYLVPRRAQNDKLTEFDGGSMLSANATLVFRNRNQRSDNNRIIERTWKNRVVFNFLNLFGSADRNRVCKEKENENSFCKPRTKDNFKCSSQDVLTTAILFSLLGIEMNIEKDNVITTSLFVCLIVFFLFFFSWGFFGIQNLNYYSPANSSAACCIDCRAQSIDRSIFDTVAWIQQRVETMSPTMLIDFFNALFSTKSLHSCWRGFVRLGLCR